MGITHHPYLARNSFPARRAGRPAAAVPLGLQLPALTAVAHLPGPADQVVAAAAHDLQDRFGDEIVERGEPVLVQFADNVFHRPTEPHPCHLRYV